MKWNGDSIKYRRKLIVCNDLGNQYHVIWNTVYGQFRAVVHGGTYRYKPTEIKTLDEIINNAKKIYKKWKNGALIEYL